jgi:hypothetical protein
MTFDCFRFPQTLAVFVFGLGLFLILASQTGYACTCPRDSTVLTAYQSAELVIIARIVSVHKDAQGSQKTVPSLHGVESTTMLVEKVYKGNVRIGEELVFSQGQGSDCIWAFEEGEIGRRYLFYLDQPYLDRYHGSVCTRSNAVERAGDDLLYLDKLDIVRGKTRISGKLGSLGIESPLFGFRKVRIINGKNVWEVTTDKNGVYEIYDLPAGEYLIEPDIPSGWKINAFLLRRFAASFSGNRHEDMKSPIRKIPVILEEKRHAGLDIMLDIDNAIRGKLISPIGQPMKGVCLEAVQANSGKSGAFGCTNAEGEFDIRQIRPGDYFLIAIPNDTITGDEPIQAFYCPGISDRRNARMFSIGAGTFFDDVIMRLPKMTERINISGKLVYSDGRLVTNSSALLQFRAGTDPESPVITQNVEKGVFSASILKGLEGVISGIIFAGRGEFQDCPALDKIMREEGGRLIFPVSSSEIRISGTEDISSIQLSFPFPFCKRSEGSLK